MLGDDLDEYEDVDGEDDLSESERFKNRRRRRKLDPDFAVAASWATEPHFYRAPHPSAVTPREYQHAGVEYVINRDHALIGDEPGIGKTAQGILISNSIGARKTLVICPASLRLNWEREIWRWSTTPNVQTYPIAKSSDGVSNTAHYVILSWALISNPSIHAALMAERWDHIIMDEAHALKDPGGNKRTKAVCGWMDHGKFVPGLAEVCGRMTPLSGTIAPNQPKEVYNIIRLLNHEAIDNVSLEDFCDFYYGMGEGMIRSPVFDPEKQVWANKLHYSNQVRNAPRNLEDLQRRLRKFLMVRRLKEDVLSELPEKIWHPFPIAVTSAIKSALKHPGWTDAARLYDMDPEAFAHGIPVDGEISTARRLLGEAKAPSVADYIEELLDSGVRKVVVGALHRSVLGILRERLTKYGLTYLDGGTSPKAKQKAADDFQQSDKIRIILGQIGVIGEGWTLTEAQDAVLAEPDYTPGKNTQFLDRIHRLGQRGQYLIGHVPIVAGTLDERVISTAVRKDQSIHKMLDAR
jgi:SWI/SNF-related matrix-associated actin-dependent regulator 1 of chromatin subfamily A